MSALEGEWSLASWKGFLLIAIVPLLFGVIWPGDNESAKPVEFAGVEFPHAQADRCSAPLAIVGVTAFNGDVLTAYTNALLFVPECDTERVLEISGTVVDGVGATVTVSLSDRTVLWHGVAGSEAALIRLPGREPSWVSYTNDIRNDRGDRNLFVTVTPP